MSPKLSHDFIRQLAAHGASNLRFKWFVTVVVALSSFNYPEEIGPLYQHLLEEYIPVEDHAAATRKIREALVKAAGLHGAAKTGNAVRELYHATPPHLIDNTCYRDDDEHTAAVARGDAFLKSLYRDVPDLNTEDDFVRKCCPDYFYVVSQLLYPHVFSFDKILDKLESSQAIITALISIDCKGQARNHMKGMMWNGATRQEVANIRDSIVLLARYLGVQFRDGPVLVPDDPKEA
ncbi:hypothetical protein BDQ94DRAFT_184434 [Aspergillus welwitschiae]|uniref:AhpD-like protein n=1 Tax=Aspergillus welwitschiae TaxID=1341132 RepID=A0A3F3PKY0_9EURO|nr:hypothetical protein BDQ94DRAFT_184434 [Aspergillus welwitschiae]RDH27577.1 hypothetical protein BDQ94DRAFT_184434 [Aspergillus welwitschiae]